MEIFKYVLRNVVKRPVRAVFIIAAGVLAGLVMVFSVSLGLQVSDTIKKDTVAKLTGHIWIPSASSDFKIEFKEEDKPRYAKEVEIIRNYLGNHPNTEALVGWYHGTYEIQAGGGARTYTLITATDFEKDARYRERTEVQEGTFPSAEQKYTCIVTTGLAKKYSLKIDDSLVLFIPSVFGARNANDFTITGIVYASAPYYEGITIHIDDFVEMAELTDISPYYKAYIKNENELPQMVKEVKAQLTDFPVQAYTDDAFIRFFLSLGTSNIIFFGGMALILFLALLIGINSVILQNIFDRRDEIGTLRALGFQRSTVRNIFFGETVILLLVGYILGTLLVIGIAAYFKMNLVRPPLVVLQYLFGMTRMGIMVNLSSVVLPFFFLFGILTLTTSRTIGRETEKQAVDQMANR
jgi:ABC-type lipoprotein release transport system permease subunit